MSHSKEAEKGDDCIFKWGKKRGVGGKNQDAQFYESFTYDGTEYFLYDCVYVYEDGEPEPHVGKLVKIWEQKSQKKKRIKIMWFFRPIELLNLLGDDEPLKNEILLASGEGVGLYNMNPLEAINGKCNVICTSKDNRNPQPSEEELKAADYIFYRSFDVGNRTISDRLGDSIAGIEAKYIFNRKEGKEPGSTSKPGANGKEENGCMEWAPKDDKVDSITSSVAKPDASLKVSSVIPDVKNSVDSNPKSRQESVFDEKKAADKPGLDSNKDADPENRPSKKSRLDNINLDKVSSTSPLYKDSKTESSVKRPRVDPDDGVARKPFDTPAGISDDKSKRKTVNDSVGLDDRLSKKVKLDEKGVLSLEETKHKITSGLALEKDNKTGSHKFEVTKRPDDPLGGRQGGMSTAGGKGERICYRCGAQGHTSNRCRMRTKVCYTCGSRDHLAKACPQAAAAAASAIPRPQQHFQQQKPMQPLPPMPKQPRFRPQAQQQPQHLQQQQQFRQGAYQP